MPSQAQPAGAATSPWSIDTPLSLSLSKAAPRFRSTLSCALPAALMLLLAACTAPDGPPPARMTEGLPVADRQEAVHAVRFAPGSPAPDEAERRRLGAFLDALRLRPGDRVAVEYREEEASAIAERRTASLLDALQSRGLRAVRRGWEAGLGPDLLRVAADRTTLAAPGCPDWTEDMGAKWLNRPAPNLGCATAANLAAQAARPADLVEGEVPGPAYARAAPRASGAAPAAAGVPGAR